MLCCALGISAIAMVAAWRRILMAITDRLGVVNMRNTTFATAVLSLGAGGIAIVAVHGAIHAEMHQRAMAWILNQPLCTSPALPLVEPSRVRLASK